MSDYFYLLLLLIVVHQQYCIHVLVNKVMSRNFHEYQTTLGLNNKEHKVKVDNEIPEDLRAIQDLGFR